MAANVETMFYTREKPWHGLGVRVEEAPASADALRMAGLDWEVLQQFIQMQEILFLATRPMYVVRTKEYWV